MPNSFFLFFLVKMGSLICIIKQQREIKRTFSPNKKNKINGNNINNELRMENFFSFKKNICIHFQFTGWGKIVHRSVKAKKFFPLISMFFFCVNIKCWTNFIGKLYCSRFTDANELMQFLFMYFFTV